MYIADTIVSQTAAVFACTPTELIGHSRKRPIVEARQAAMWAIRQRYPSLSLATIGTTLGGRHYSTVMHALVAVEARAQRRIEYRLQLECVMEQVSIRSQPARFLNPDRQSTIPIALPVHPA